MMIPLKIHVLIVCTNCVRVKKKYRLEINTENKREIEKRLPDENYSCSAAEVSAGRQRLSNLNFARQYVNSKIRSRELLQIEK